MAYLTQEKIVHRDLAARNCMLDKIDDYLVAKVSDFGLSRQCIKDYYKIATDRKLPFAWMPPECLDPESISKFNEKTDGWSFGVVLWELLTRGQTPYEEVNMICLYSHLMEGNRLEIPQCCPIKLRCLIEDTWLAQQESRPTFQEIVEILNDIYIEHVDFQMDMDMEMDNCLTWRF